jgi:hypothetical protein
MSAHLDLTTYFTGPDTDSGDKFTYESEIALGLTKAAGKFSCIGSEVLATVKRLAHEAGSHVTILNPSCSLITREHPLVVAIGFEVVEIHLDYGRIQVNVLEGWQDVHANLTGYTTYVQSEAWKSLGEHMAHMVHWQ